MTNKKLWVVFPLKKIKRTFQQKHHEKGGDQERKKKAKRERNL
jgi:hypothetical protein